MALRDQLHRLAREMPAYGYRRMRHELCRRSLVVNHKGVLRLRREDHRQLGGRPPSANAPPQADDTAGNSAGQAQRFLASYGPIASHFRPRRHFSPAKVYRQEMTQRFQAWREIAGTTTAA
jgi:hypothetical protein